MGNCFLYKRGFGGFGGGSGGGSGGGGEDVPGIEKTASGKVISILDSMEKPLKGLRLFGKTTQNGTPSPDAPVPLVSAGDGGSIGVNVSGKNLIDFSKRLPGYELTGNLEIDRQIVANNKWYVTDWIPVEPLTQYTVSGLSSTFCLQADKNYNGIKASQVGNTFRTQENVRFLRFNSIQEGYSTPQLEKGSVATVYEPYEGQSATFDTPNGLPGIHVSEGGNYTDENGWQWICDEVDFAKGVYVQRVRVTNLAVSDMNNNEDYPGWRNVANLSTDKPNTNASLLDYICNITEAGISGRIAVNTVGSSPTIYLPKAHYGLTQTEWKTNHPDLTVSIMYAIATPIEKPLTSQELAQYAALRTLSPSTTLYNDADSYMEVKYMAKGG